MEQLRDSSLFIEKGYIGGAWVNAQSGNTFEVDSPSTGKTIGRCPEFSTHDTELAIKAAAKAFPSSRNTRPRERARLLRKWQNLMLANQEELSWLITLESGKALVDARAEVLYAASFLEWYSEEAPRIYGDFIPASNSSNPVIAVKEPVGVCGLITPWNFPAAMVTRKAGAAIAAGCTIVIKSPGETPFTVNALVKLAELAGFPSGVINVVTALKSTVEVGRTLTLSPLIDKISFTGSTEVGKHLMRQCAETTLKKVSLELGGNAPFIVFNDADLDAAVAGLIASKFRGSGQTCVCPNRIYVQSRVYDEFSTKLARFVRDKFVVGDSLKNPAVTHGPLIHGRGVEKVDQHVRDAVSRGAKILTGGNKLPQLGLNFFQPTILTEMTNDMQLASEETFGPVAGLFRFTTEEEVVELANSSDVGLAAYFYSKDAQRIWRMASALQVGMVGANTGVISDPAMPFGGVKSSGFGREGSLYGIDDYTVVKMITFGSPDSSRQSRL